MTVTSPRTISKTLDLAPADAIARVKVALGEQGFGVLTEIDVAATLHEKVGATLRPYTILGACNPALALRALEADPEVGLMLPCNVIVHEVADGVRVAAVDPEQLLGLIGGAELRQAVAEVRKNLAAAIDELARDQG